MTVDERLSNARDARQRRQRRYLWLVVGLLLLSTVASQTVPRWSAQGVLMWVGVMAAFVLGDLYAERSDGWQRHRALIAFAVGGLAGLLMSMSQVAIMGLDGGYRANPQIVVKVLVSVWVLTDIAIRQLPGVRSARRAESA